MAGDGQIVFLDGQAVRVQAERQSGGSDDGVAVGHGQHVQPQPLVGLSVGGVAGRGAGAEQDVLTGAEQQHGAGRGSAREIADVGGAGDQGGRGSGGGVPVAQQPASDGVHL